MFLWTSSSPPMDLFLLIFLYTAESIITGRLISVCCLVMWRLFYYLIMSVLRINHDEFKLVRNVPLKPSIPKVLKRNKNLKHITLLKLLQFYKPTDSIINIYLTIMQTKLWGGPHPLSVYSHSKHNTTLVLLHQLWTKSRRPTPRGPSTLKSLTECKLGFISSSVCLSFESSASYTSGERQIDQVK